MHRSILFGLVVFCSFIIPISAFSQTISGTLDSSAHGAVTESTIYVRNASGDPDPVASVNTDGSGFWTVELPDGDYFLWFHAWGAFDGYVSEYSDGTTDLPCPDDTCDWFNLAPTVTLLTGSPLTVNNTLNLGAVVSGTIEEDGAPGTPVYPVNVTLRDPATGGTVAGTTNNPEGDYQLPAVLAGSYKLYFDAVDAASVYLDELNDEIICINLTSCDVASEGDAISVSIGVNTIDEQLVAGLLISGTVKDGSNNPIPGVHVDLLDQSGNFVGNSPTDESTGEWSIPVVGAGNYFAYTPDWSTGSFVPEVWDDTICRGCDAVATGDPIVVVASDFSGVNFVLEPGLTISGTLDSSAHGAVTESTIYVRNASGDPDPVASVNTDGSGFWTVELPDGDYFLWFHAWGAFDGYVSEYSDGTTDLPCPDDTCDWFNLAPTVTLLTGSPLTVNNTLNLGAVVSGTIEEDGAPGTPVYPVNVTLRDPATGGTVAGTTNNPEGDYQLPAVLAGSYKLYFDAVDAASVYLDELNDEIICINLTSCDVASEGDAISVSIGVNTIDEQLVAGLLISGTVKDGSNNPIPGVHVDLLDQSGNFVGNSPTDESTGEWSIPVVGAGNYFAYTPDWSTGSFVPEVWDDTICRGCDAVATGDPIVVVASDFSGVNFVLEPGFVISGVIKDEFDVLIDEGYVDILDASGDWLLTAWNDGGGNYQSPVLPDGTYYAYAWGEDWDRVTQLYNGESCAYAACDILGIGEPIMLTGSDEGGINFNIPMRTYDWTISGHIWDSAGNPGPGGAVAIYNQIGQEIDHWWVDGDGWFETYPLPDGIYYAITRYSWEVLAEAWENNPCPNNLCDTAASTPIIINGDNKTDINFLLDPITSGGVISGQVLDDIGTPLPYVTIVVRNAVGRPIWYNRADENGFYQTPLLTDQTYFLLTTNEPFGLGRELWRQPFGFDGALDDGNLLCLPASQCDDWGFITGNGDAIGIEGLGDITGTGDVGDVDFVLGIPLGFMISGTVTDADTGAPLPDVEPWLTDEFGNYITNTTTDALGNYYFSGLNDLTNYKVFVAGPPDGYQHEFYLDAPCPNWDCDWDTVGNDIYIDGLNEPGRDIVLDYQGGTRIFGTVTRSDGGVVSSQLGYMGVQLYDSGGNWIDERSTNNGGQYQFTIDPDTNYYVVTTHDTQFHGLINEIWDGDPGFGIPCFDNCEPIPNGGVAINVASGNVAVANFDLDPGEQVAGRVTDGSLGLGNIEVCAQRRNDGWWVGCALTDGDGYYTIGGLQPSTDLAVFIQSTNGAPFQTQMYDGQPCCDLGTATPVSTAYPAIGGIDFVLSSGTLVQGTLTTAGDDPIDEGAVTALLPDGTWVAAASVDQNGFWSMALPGDTTYIFFFDAWGFFEDYLDEYSDGAGSDLPCFQNDCDWANEAPHVYVNGGPVILDNALDLSTWIISGHIFDEFGNPGPGGHVLLFNDNGEVGGPRVDDDGYFEFWPLPNGEYHALTMFTHNSIDARWDDNVGEPCPNRLCDTYGGIPISVYNGHVENIDFHLDPITSGGVISGQVLDDIGTPLPYVNIVVRNAVGRPIWYNRADENGHHQTPMLTDQTYYLTTTNEPFGLGRELWRSPYGFDGGLLDGNLLCLPASQCDDWGFITGNGDAIGIEGFGDITGTGDVGDVDFVLGIPLGFMISGTVTDADTGAPLPDVEPWLTDEFGNYITNTTTDALGNYYFSGLNDLTNYKVFVAGPPDGYQHEFYLDAPCPNWDCDWDTVGNDIYIDGLNEPGRDIVLDYQGGTRIFGTVTRSDGGVVSSQLGYMGVQLYDSGGNWIDERSTNNGGQYQFTIDPDTNYYVVTTHDTQFHGLINEIWDGDPGFGIPCFDNCEPIPNGGVAINVASGNVAVANFDLDPGEQVAGRVTDGSLGLGNIEVCAQRRNDGWWVGCALTDGDGYYTIGGLQPSTDLAVFIQSTNGAPYQTQMYDGQPCCDLGTATPVSTAYPAIGGIDFVLAPMRLISGRLTVNDGSHSPVVREGAVNIYDGSGNWVNGTDVDDNGNWSVYLGDGDYFISFETWGTYEFYVSELHDGTQCPWYSCYGGDWVNNTTPLTIDGSWVNPLDVELDQGVIFTGTLTDELPPNDPISNLRVYFYDDDLFAAGASFEEYFVLLIRGDAGGNYRTPALPIRNILPFSTGWDLGFGREFYDDQKCDPMDCADAFANRTALVSGDDFVAGDTVTVDFDLIRRSALSGVVTDGATGIEGVTVNVWDTKSNLVDTAWTDGSGAYESNVGGHNHAAALYYVTANGENMGYVAQVYGDPANADSNAPCPQEYCVQGGIPGVTPISTLDGLDRSNINFTLAAQQPATISGVVLDQFDNPGPGGVVLILNTNGDWAGEGWVNGDGNFETESLPDGSYYAYTKHTWNTIDDRWDGIDGEQCVNQLCDLTGGEPIVISGGASSAFVYFKLDPIVNPTQIHGRITDNLGNPLANTDVVIMNRNGYYQSSTRTNENGDYQTVPLAPELYFIRTDHETLGMGRELWAGGEPANVICAPAWDCNDRSFVIANGVTIDTLGGDVYGIDFELAVPPGNIISGHVSDEASGVGLPEVYLSLFDNDGNQIAEVRTDAYGNYYFSGWPDSTYRVFASGVPQGYQQELYDNVPCDWGCDFSNSGPGTPISVSGSIEFPNNDIALIYTGGERIIATVEHAGTGVPISDASAQMLFSLYAENGDWLDNLGSDLGMREFYVAPGNYYVTVQADVQYHNTIDEVFDNQHCYGFDDCHPLAQPGRTLITVNPGGTEVAAFVLEQASTISGTVTSEIGGAPLEGIEMCLARQADGNWLECTTTGADGSYEFKGLEARNDLVVWTQNLFSQPYYKEMHQDQPCCTVSQGTPIDSALLTPIDFALTPSASLSGNVVDSTNSNPIEGVPVWLVTPQCDFLVQADTDSNGNYTISGFEEGVYYVITDGHNQGYIRSVYPNLNRLDACDPDIQDGQAIGVGALGQISGINFAVDPGGSISGVISDVNGPLAPYAGRARLYDTEGKQLFVVTNSQPDNSYWIGGLLPGSYHVVLTSNGLGLIDERYDDVPCPRNSCDLNLGVPIIVGPQEQVIGKDALLEQGTVIAGRLTDAASTNGISTCLAFYTSTGVYAGFACSDANGDYGSVTGFPDGEFLASNQFFINSYGPVDFGYLPQVWTSDGSFGDCGEPCDFLQGDTFTIDGGVVLDGAINIAMELGSSIDGMVSTGATLLSNVELQLLNSEDGSVIRSMFSDINGDYVFEGIGSGTYHLRTSNALGFEDLLYKLPTDVSCTPFCDPLSGEDIILGANSLVSINFDLLTTPGIAGKVTKDTDANAVGVRVEAYNAIGIEVASAATDADGNYTLSNLWTGDFYVRTDNTLGYVDALHNGAPCTGECDVTDGTSIPVTAGSVFALGNLQLGDAATVSGNVNNGADDLAGVTMELYLDTGAFVASATTDGMGNYSFGSLSAGDYHVISRNEFGYVDQGAGGGVCQSTCLPTSTTPVTLAGTGNEVVNFVLDLGGEVTGTVFDASSTTLPGVTIAAFNDTGEQISSTVTDSNGDYLIRGLVAGDVYLRTFNAGGFRNQLFSNGPCDAFCDVLAGTAVPVSGGIVTGKDFNLTAGFSISGSVTDIITAGIAGVLVEAFDSTDLLAGSSTSVPPVGGFSIEGLPEGDYRLRTTNNAGYVDTVVGGDSCTPEPCAISTGSLNNIAGADITGLSIQLSAGNTLPGIATVTTDTVDVPLPTGTAGLFSISGNLVKSVPVADGLFTFRGVADGTYFLLIRNDLGLIDQLWAGIDCPAGSCDVTTGTPIDVGAAPAAVESTSRLQSTKSSVYKTTAAAVEGARLEFSLEQGTTVRGSVVTEGGTAVQFVKVYIFDYQGDLAGEGITDGVGNFETDAGFPDDTWYAATQAPGTSGVGGGLTDEVYEDKTCAGDCDPVGQSATSIVTPDAADQVHFVLGSGGRISGTVSSSTTTDPIAQVRINLFDDLGSPVAQTSTDGLGQYAFEGLLNGSYHLVASPQAGSFGAVLYVDLYCDGGCDVLTGTVVTLGEVTSVDGIDFALPDDNCPNVDNTDQADSDYDGRGDACEGEPPDISSKAEIDPSASIGDGALVSQGVIIHANATVGAGSILKRNAEIGENCMLGEYVVVEQNATLGTYCSIGNGSFIGKSSSLGDYVTVGSNSIVGKDNQIGDNVVIGNNVELGPGVTVDAEICIPDGTLIKKGTKVDSSLCL